MYDSFFDVGGNSLLAAQLLDALKDMKVEVPGFGFIPGIHKEDVEL